MPYVPKMWKSRMMHLYGLNSQNNKWIWIKFILVSLEKVREKKEADEKNEGTVNNINLPGTYTKAVCKVILSFFYIEWENMANNTSQCNLCSNAPNIAFFCMNYKNKYCRLYMAMMSCIHFIHVFVLNLQFELEGWVPENLFTNARLYLLFYPSSPFSFNSMRPYYPSFLLYRSLPLISL